MRGRLLVNISNKEAQGGVCIRSNLAYSLLFEIFQKLILKVAANFSKSYIVNKIP